METVPDSATVARAVDFREVLRGAVAVREVVAVRAAVVARRAAVVDGRFWTFCCVVAVVRADTVRGTTVFVVARDSVAAVRTVVVVVRAVAVTFGVVGAARPGGV